MFVLWLIWAECEINIHCILVMFYYHDQKFVSPRMWTWKTYRQGPSKLGISERPKKYFATNRKPQKILSEKQNPKNILKNTIHFAKVKHDVIIMETHDYWSTWWIKLDPKKYCWKHETLLKYNFYLTTQKTTAAVTSTQENTDSRNSNPKNILHWSLGLFDALLCIANYIKLGSL